MRGDGSAATWTVEFQVDPSVRLRLPLLVEGDAKGHRSLKGDVNRVGEGAKLSWGRGNVVMVERILGGGNSSNPNIAEAARSSAILFQYNAHPHYVSVLDLQSSMATR